ncbi:ABC transporter substrate-binding protein [Streptomyces caniscabiei]|uniref:ABC transporter substrate-binding protein n=1 Tax=Streptomyces caniscabiei TaxID=2746961 RepID=UPI0029B76428|nr:ABC transporter substrate-binding protein [Streptomyces caniscabiei]MDX2775996.1 ABC transporter substrate-binding protein [Streptomyces caniscabiei]
MEPDNEPVNKNATPPSFQMPDNPEVAPPPPPMQGAQEKPARPERHRPGLKWILYVLALIVLVGGGVSAYMIYTSQTAPANKPLKVGVLMAFSGGSSSMGYGTMKGIQLAKKQLGANSIELVQADSRCEPNEARKAAQSLIDQGVVAIIGDGCSSASVAVLPMANNSKTVMVSPSASSPALSIPNDYFFRVIPSDTYQGEFMAETIRGKGYENVAVMYTNEPYGANMSRVFQEKFDNLGGSVVATAYSEPDVIDLTTQMQKIKDARPQAVFIAPNSVVTATAAMNIGHDLGLDVPLYGADIMYDKTVISNAKEASQGLTVSTFPTGTGVFRQMLLNEYKVDEQLYAAPQAYDAFEAIYRAIQSGATTGEQIKDKLPSISFDGMSAKISFDQNGEEPGKDYAYDLFKVEGETFVKVEE